MTEAEIEFVDEDDAALEASEAATFSQAVLYSSDWTVETILSQLNRKNIELNPRFQRRDAWSIKGKSRFVESIILGLPIPQIVLAEKKGQRGQFIVLDGKQRLLSLIQFTGKASVGPNGFALSGLEARQDLVRKKFKSLENDPDRRDDLNAFLNHTIRTVVIRNWPSTEFLHLVFLRLNTGSVKLSPQELRQAMVPGPFSNFVDDAAEKSKEIQSLLSRTSPDPRMRDVELLVRHLAFKHRIEHYSGRMKSFLDDTCEYLNENWEDRKDELAGDVEAFKLGAQALIDTFGADGIARKSNSRSFNRAIFDALIYYAVDQNVRDFICRNKEDVKKLYDDVLDSNEFQSAIESDTAGIPHTHARLSIWGQALKSISGEKIIVPSLDAIPGTDTMRIRIK